MSGKITVDYKEKRVPTRQESIDRINLMNEHGDVSCPERDQHQGEYYAIKPYRGHRFRCGCGCQFMWKSETCWKIMYTSKATGPLSEVDKAWMAEVGLIDKKLPKVLSGKVKVVYNSDSNGFDEMIKNAKKIVMENKDIFVITVEPYFTQEGYTRLKKQLETILGKKQKILMLTDGVDIRKIAQTDLLEIDTRLIQLTKNVRSKIDEAKAKIQEHIRDDHRDDDIYKFLAHTRRGRLLCRLFGYKHSDQRRLTFAAAKKKMATKVKKLEV